MMRLLRWWVREPIDGVKSTWYEALHMLAVNPVLGLTCLRAG
jgi:hypothetical protein